MRSPSPANVIGRFIVLFAVAILSFGSINAVAQTSVTLNAARHGHTATVLADGRVLVFGGDAAGATEATAEIVDIGAGTSTSVSLTGVAARTGHTATRLADGRVLIAGGSESGVPVGSTLFIDAAGNASPGPSMSSSRSGHTAVYFSGTNNVLFIGGDATGTAEVLDVAAGTSQLAPSSMSTPRSGHSSIVMNDGRVLIVGGDGLNTAEIFDGSTFTPTGNAMTLARAGALLRTLPDGKVQIIGGNNDGSMEVYDPAIDTIGAYAHVVPVSDPCANLINHVLRAATRSALIYSGASDPERDRSNFTVTELGNGQALVIGGTGSNGTAITVFQSSDATVTTDKLDYAPGETATISGTGFAPGETVRVMIHEDPHTANERGFDATADASGNFTGTYLVQDYDLRMRFVLGARGLTSGRTAQTTFTDDISVNVLAGPSGTTFTLTKTVYGVSACNGVGTTTVISNVNATTAHTAAVLDNNGSVKLQASATSNQGSAFSSWTSANGFNVIDAFTICVNGANANQTRTFTANYVNNVAPTVTGVTISGPAVYGQTLTGSYTYNDANGDAQGTSTFRWLRNGTTVVGTNLSYTTVSADVGQNLTFEVTPVASTGTSPGIAVASSAVTVAKKSLTVTPDPQSIAFGAADPTFTFQYSGGFVGSDNAAGIDTPPTCGVTGPHANAGTYTINCSGGTDNNYQFTYGTATLTVGKAATTTTVTCPASVTFTGSALTPCTATVTGAGGLNESVTVTYSDNTIVGTATANASYAETANYGASNGSKTFAIAKASSTTTITCPTSVTYTGAALTSCTATATGAGSLSASVNVVYTDNTNAGTAKADATYAGDANHEGSTATQVTFTIEKATANCVSIAGAAFTYDGNAHVGTGSCKDLGGNDLASLTWGTGQTNVPGGSVTWSFTSADPNYANNPGGSVTVTINPAVATVNVTGYTGTYDGNAHGATGSATGVNANDVSSLLNLGAQFTNVPGGTANWTFNAGSANPNYTEQSGSVQITINKANASCNISGYTGTFDGSAHGATGSCTGIGGTELSGLNLGASFTDVPGGTAAWVFTDVSGNYNNASGSAAIVITQASSTTVVTCPVGVPYNSLPQTPCTVSVTGVGLNLTPGANYTSNENVGTATASYTFGGDTNHSGSSDSKTFEITKVALIVSGAVAQNKVYNSNNAATVDYVSAVLTNKIAGDDVSIDITDPLYSATFDDENVGDDKPVTVVGLKLSGADAGNYTVSQPTGLKAHITRQQLTLVGAVAQNRPYDGGFVATVLFSAAQLENPQTGDNVDFDATLATATFADKNVGNVIAVTVIGVTLTGADAGNYELAQPTGLKANITPAQLIASVIGNPTKVYDGSTDATLGSGNYQIFGLAVGESFTITKVAGSYNDPNVLLASTVTVTLAATDFTAGNAETHATNYSLPASASGPGKITKAASTTTVTFDAGPYVYRGTAFTATANVTGAGSLSQPVTPVNYTGDCTNVTSANGCSASAQYAGDDNHFGSEGNASITILPATPTVTVSFAAAEVTYNAAAHPATVTVNGVAGQVLTDPTHGTIALTYTPNVTPVNAGDYTASATFTSTNANYTNALSNIATLKIKKADAVCSINGFDSVYDGDPHGATGSCTGVDAGNAAAGGSLNLGSQFTNVPGGTANWNLTGGSNYNDQTGSVAIKIAKANATIDVDGYSGVYDAASHGATGTATGVKGEDLSSLLNLGDSFTNVPGGTANWSFAGNSNYNGTSGTAAITITKAALTVTASSPTVTYFDTKPAISPQYSGFISGEGASNLTAIPTCSTTYEQGSNVGSYPTTCSGGDAVNYSFEYVAGSVTVGKATSTTTVSCPVSVVYNGVAQTPCTASYSGVGNLSGPLTPSYLNNTGPGTATASASYPGDTNHVGSTGSATFEITNVPVSNVSVTSAVINENDTATLTVTFVDPDLGQVHTGTINWGDGSGNLSLGPITAGTTSFTVSRQFLDDHPSTGTPFDIMTVAVTITDGPTTAAMGSTVKVNNLAPVISSASGPTVPLALGSSTSISAAFTDVGTKDTHPCVVNWDDGTTSNGTVTEANGNGTCTASKIFAAPGVYSVTVTVNDDDTGTATLGILQSYVVVFDPNAGFVTGGGFVDSPTGACTLTTACTVQTGKANFGFVSKYKKGSNTPEGETEFQFHAGDLKFKSSAYEVGSLVISSFKAQYKGTGAVNGMPGYRFILTAYDGAINGAGNDGIDKFRIRILDSNNNPVYDNGLNASNDIDLANPSAISGGSIVIHKAAK